MDLRRQPRFPFTSRITIGWQNGSANYLIHARCLDISRTGLRIESPDRIPTGERVGIEIQSAHLHTSATVRYCRHSGLTFIIGLEFGFGANATIDKIIQSLTTARAS